MFTKMKLSKINIFLAALGVCFYVFFLGLSIFSFLGISDYSPGDLYLDALHHLIIRHA